MVENLLNEGVISCHCMTLIVVKWSAVMIRKVGVGMFRLHDLGQYVKRLGQYSRAYWPVVNRWLELL